MVMSTRMSHLHASSLLLHVQLKAWNLLGSFSHIIASFLLSLYSLHIWYSPPVGLGYYLTSDTVFVSSTGLQTAQGQEIISIHPTFIDHPFQC